MMNLGPIKMFVGFDNKQSKVQKTMSLMGWLEPVGVY